MPNTVVRPQAFTVVITEVFILYSLNALPDIYRDKNMAEACILILPLELVLILWIMSYISQVGN